MDDAAATGGRQLAPGLHALEDLGRGEWYETGSVTLTTDMIDRFAELSGDRFEIHMDAEAARRLGFADRVAHGLLVLSLVDGLKNQSDVRLLAVASLGWDWHFLAPVLAGDTISAG